MALPEKTMAVSHAPAGGTYRGIEHAGQCTLRDNANNFPYTEHSCMIPPMFKTKYPEPKDAKTGEILKTSRALTEKEENRFIGMARNACGEEAEYAVFRVLEKLVKSMNNPPICVIRNYVLQNFKVYVLASELGITLDDIQTAAEFDAVILIKDTGLILTEVKRRFSEEQQVKAEDQLENGKLFFEQIMIHFTGSTGNLPVLKVIMFPEESSASPTTRSDRGTYIFHKDLLSNFNQKWEELKGELYASKSTSSFTKHGFHRFVHIVTGVWCMEKYQKRFYRYNNDQASSAYQLHENDNMINRAILTSDFRSAKNETKIVETVTDLELCLPKHGFPTCEGIDLIYLTPEQKNLLLEVPQTIIRGSAGSGKTLVSYLKIIQILQNHPNKNILIIAPHPHHLRIEQFVKSNGGQTNVTKTFPPTVSGGVVIITIKNFFEVVRTTLRSYDVSMYHVLIDDLQSTRLDGAEEYSKFSDVSEFIERVCTNLVGTDQTFWCAVDEGQSEILFFDERYNVTSLFNVNKTTPRNIYIPIYILDKTLRNSVEISNFAQKVRESRVADTNASSYVLTNSKTGHQIRTETVTYHVLTRWTSGWYDFYAWERHGNNFVVERVKEELMSLLSPQQSAMKFNEIAILYACIDDVVGISFDGPVTLRVQLQNMLLSVFNITPQTIEEYIITNKDTIIFDDPHNFHSFECACVLYVCCFNPANQYLHYNMVTRARTKLIVVDFDYSPRQSFLTDEVIIIKWKESDGEFLKL